MQEYAKDTTDAETGKLLLMLDNAKDRNERQAILDNTDMDYIDQDIIAKDNQEFDIGEERKAEALFNRTMQKEAAARDILGRKTTAEYQAESLKNQRKEAELKALQQIEDTKLKTAATKTLAESKQRTFDQAAARNKKANEHEEYLRSVAKGAAEQRKTVFDQGQTEWAQKQNLKEAGENLTKETLPLIDGTNDVQTLLNIKNTLRNEQIKENPAAPALLKKVITKLGTKINFSNLFPTKPGVPTPTMTITGKTQDEKRRSANSNLQRTVDRLSVYLPRSTKDDLKSMASSILRNSSPEYRKAMKAAEIPSEELNTTLDLELKGELNALRQSEGKLTLDELQEHEDRINLLEVNKDSATGIENSLKRVNVEYAKVFARTPLTNIVPEESQNKLAKYMDFGTLPWPADKVIDKKAVKQRHKSNIQNIIGLIPAIHKNRLSYEELQQKVSNYLTRQPAYARVLDDAKISYDTATTEKIAKANFKWAGIKETIDDDSSIEAITKAYTWADKNLEENRDTELTKLTERLNKKLDNDGKFLNKSTSAYAIYTKINDPSGKKDANGNIVKIDHFDPGEYKKFREHTKRDIVKEYKYVSESAINKMLDGIIANDTDIVRAKTAYDDMLAFEKQYTQENNLAIIARKIEASNFADVFSRTPVVALAGHDLKVHNTIAVISGVESVADRADTFKDSVDFSRHVYDTLRKEYGSSISVGELGNRAKKAIASLPPEAENVGDEYTRRDFMNSWIYSLEQIKKAAEATQ
jgi:hypothetical protein